ncbi:MAG: hypothetical protein RR348_01815 [Clostridia bacterium]
MKYDNQTILNSDNHPNENIVRHTTKRKKLRLLDMFVGSSIVCVVISCGILISKLVGLGV